ncbi:hypothetical protein [Chryseobacterium caseinilyticum]|uniref:hypothetical protein n=1 Tax=Chryseobacterium caseinilyticum TaxID=2771428 RepID=UPI003743E4EC
MYQLDNLKMLLIVCIFKLIHSQIFQYLEYGMKIKLIELNFIGVGFDTPENLEKARKLI